MVTITYVMRNLFRDASKSQILAIIEKQYNKYMDKKVVSKV